MPNTSDAQPLGYICNEALQELKFGEAVGITLHKQNDPESKQTIPVFLRPGSDEASGAELLEIMAKLKMTVHWEQDTEATTLELSATLGKKRSQPMHPLGTLTLLP